MVLSGASSLEILSSSGPVAAEAVSFASGSTGVFKIDLAQSFTGSLAGFTGAGGQAIDLANISFASAHLSYSAASKILKVTDGTNTASIKMVGTYSAASFAVVNDGGGHTEVVGPSPSLVHAMVAVSSGLGAMPAAIGQVSATSARAPSEPLFAVCGRH
jgi:hypothetical protein